MSNIDEGITAHYLASEEAKSGKPFTLLLSKTVSATPRQAYSRNALESCVFELILSGKGELHTGGRTYDVNTGDMYALLPNQPHSYKADEKEPWTKQYFVCIGPAVNALLSAYGICEPHFPEFAAKGIFRKIHSIFEARLPDMHERAAIEFHKLAIELHDIINGRSSRYSKSVKQAMDFMEENIEVKIGMKDIAAHVNLTAAHLGRTFKTETGTAPYDWLLAKRIELAQTLLECTDLAISEIADRLCYADAYYFSNSFKKAVGVSPSKYRRQKF